jgi:hypothetical protein
MTLHAPSRTSSALRSGLPGRQTTAGPSLQTSSRRIGCPFGAPSPRNPLPGTSRSPGIGRRLSPSVAPVVPSRLTLRWTAVPRRGVPTPLRSASAVSHDPGGLLLLGPGGVFHPLTPLGFCSRLPDACFRSMGPKTQLPGARPCDAYQGACHTMLGGRAFAQEAPGRLPGEQLPKQPPSVKSRSQTRRTGSGSSSPLRLQAISGS